MLGLLAAAMAALPTQVLAQSTNTPPPKPMRHPPVHGKLAAVDLTAKTLKVADTTYEVTSTTRIMKDGKPATLEDGVVGENVSIVWAEKDGQKEARSVYFGTRPERKKHAPPAATNNPPAAADSK